MSIDEPTATSENPTYRIAVDIGGTFTDVVAIDNETRVETTAKVPSTPEDYSLGVIQGIEQLLGPSGRLTHFVHGTTAGLNSILQRRGARTALVTTSGFKDVYAIARANRTDMYNLFYRRPTPLVGAEHIFEVEERVLADGSVHTEMDEDDVVALANDLAEAGYESVAIVFLHSYANPSHEQRVGELLGMHAPGVFVSLSHAVANEYREYERTSTTVLNAYVAPVMHAYLTRLEHRLRERGYMRPAYIMRSGGGVMTAERAKREPVQTLMSGPVGGAVGCEVLAGDLDEPNLICVDMGGTSFDISLVIDGRLDESGEVTLEGFPVLAPMVEVHSLGAGGGSIAHQEAGILRVGPRSAGGSPGPACYGLGGADPTVTDANVITRRIVPENFLGGRMPLDVDAAAGVLDGLACELGYDREGLANGILDVTNAGMANAIRTVTVRRGVDPRDFALVAFGGAGPLHAVALAEELGIPRVIVANTPGTFSAYGMLNTDLRHDEVAPNFQAFDEVEASELERAYLDLEGAVAKALSEQGVPADEVIFERSADVRYIGQEFTVNMGIARDLDDEKIAGLPDTFNAAYLARHGHANPDERAEFLNLRVTGFGELAKARRQPRDTGEVEPPEPITSVDVQTRDGLQSTPVFERAGLQPGSRIQGPALIQEPFCTTVVSASFDCRVDGLGTLVLDRSEGDRRS